MYMTYRITLKSHTPYHKRRTCSLRHIDKIKYIAPSCEWYGCVHKASNREPTGLYCCTTRHYFITNKVNICMNFNLTTNLFFGRLFLQSAPHQDILSDYGSTTVTVHITYVAIPSITYNYNSTGMCLRHPR